MDGIKYSDSFVDRNEYQTDEEYKAALKSYEHDHLATIESLSNRGSFRGGSSAVGGEGVPPSQVK